MALLNSLDCCSFLISNLFDNQFTLGNRLHGPLIRQVGVSTVNLRFEDVQSPGYINARV